MDMIYFFIIEFVSCMDLLLEYEMTWLCIKPKKRRKTWSELV